MSPTKVSEEIVRLTLPQAAEQALWDLRQWTKDHAKDCECFTCRESIPDLSTALGEHLDVPASA
jgi:hypothetical protein